MKGYVRQRGDRYCAMIYEGRDPVTGKERRSWHPAATDRAEAKHLAERNVHRHVLPRWAASPSGGRVTNTSKPLYDTLLSARARHRPPA